MSPDSEAKTWKPTIVLVGGFLGSGKTTLILAAARVLSERGLKSAVILNDQGSELVDTRLAQSSGLAAGEVTGGCFCCRLSALESAIDGLHLFAPDVIFVEPVGSCTDISATVLNPLRNEFDRYRIAPFTVLVDPVTAASLAQPDADLDLVFLFRSQLDEADLIRLTKSDVNADPPSVAAVGARSISARTGQGIREWLDEVLFGAIESGAKLLDIDYVRYAEAEAALAWLNLSFVLTPDAPISPSSAIGTFFDSLDRTLTAASIPILHMKIFDSSPEGWLKAAICANSAEPTVEGDLTASPSSRHEILLNLRAKGDSNRVRRIVEDRLTSIEGYISDLRLDCFSPAPPQPERRVLERRR